MGEGVNLDYLRRNQSEEKSKIGNGTERATH